MGGFVQDLRVVFRLWRRNRVVTVAVILTLGVAMGALCTAFGTLNAVVFRPLPYRQPEELLALFNTVPHSSPFARLLGTNRLNFSYLTFEDIRAENDVFAGVAAYRTEAVNLASGTGPERVQCSFVSARYFEVLGVEPAFGRSLLPEEFVTGAGRPLLLSDALWRRHFGGRAEVLGRTVLIDETPAVIVGVMPADFTGMHSRDWGTHSRLIQSRRQPELWTPFTAPLMRRPRDSHNCDIVARLRAGVSVGQARAEMELIATRLEQRHKENKDWGIEVAGLQEAQRGSYRTFLWILMGAASILLVIAVVNTAGLLLEQGLGRQSEIAVRTALGANRLRILRQVFIEGLTLSLAAALFGLGLSLAGCRLINLVLAGIVVGLPRVEIGAAVLGSIFLIAVAVGAVFALLPLTHLNHGGTFDLLKGARSVAGPSRRRSAQHALVVLQTALTVVLLIGAGLLLKTLVRFSRVDPGCRTDQVLTMQLNLPPHTDTQRRRAYFQRVLQRVSALPGVRSAGLAESLPVTGATSTVTLAIEGRSDPESQSVWAFLESASPGYFSTLGIPLRSGRLLTEEDRQGAPPTILINETLAEEFWKNKDPVGSRVRLNGQSCRIVGVVGDVRQDGLDKGLRAGVYTSYQQSVPFSADLAIWAERRPGDLADPVRKAILSVDPTVPVSRLRTMDKVIADAVLPPRLIFLLVSSLAAIALLLALLGTYALLSYRVTRGTKELALRMALGAQSGDLLRWVLSRGLLLTGTGQVVGVMISIALTRSLRSQLYGVSPTDVQTFVLVCLGLSAAAVLACLLPARRATRVSPVQALKCD